MIFEGEKLIIYKIIIHNTIHTIHNTIIIHNLYIFDILSILHVTLYFKYNTILEIWRLDIVLGL